MKLNSLTLRLAMAAAGVIGLSLAATGLLLVFLFRGHIESKFDQEMSGEVDELVAASEIDRSGVLALTWFPVEPKFKRPGSGWYWRITRDGDELYHSASLQGMTLDLADSDRPGIYVFDGPTERRLRAFSQPITLPGSNGVFVYTVAGPVGEIDRDVWRFLTITTTTLAALGLGLITAMIVQVRFGLLPLAGLRRALADIRTGRLQRMPESFPDEVEPVVEELNALLDHNAMLLERARVQAGNLAHALKHPLTVMIHETRQVEGERGQILSQQLAAMRGSINRYLSRARAAGPGGATGVRTNAAEVVEGLRFSLDRLYRERGIAISVDGFEGLFFAGDPQDLEEILGNLMDNACKWSRREVRISGALADGWLKIAVEDDGPGIPDGERDAVLMRGRRLDETIPGAGLGLDIAHDIIELYRGVLRLEQSAGLGGLKVEVTLPAAFGPPFVSPVNRIRR